MTEAYKLFSTYVDAIGETQTALAAIIDIKQPHISAKCKGREPVYEVELLALECILRRRRKWPVK